MTVRKAIFIDKDGTLIRDVPYNISPDLISISENAVKGLKQLTDAGYHLIVVSNQSGVAMGFFELSALSEVEKTINWILKKHDIYIDGFYFCPHHPKGIISEYSIDCKCRKPKNGLILIAARDHPIDLSQSWMIGDILDDIQAGNLSGCKSILINNGNETIWKMNNQRTPDFMAQHINQAAEYILAPTAHQNTATMEEKSVTI